MVGKAWYQDQLRQASAHVDQGNCLIARQAQRIAELKSHRLDANWARDLLELMEDLQSQHLEHQRYLEHEIEKFDA